MSLLREIQTSLMQQGQDIGPILLKLRFLASRLGSASLEEWVRYESEGYPGGVSIPDYRKLGVSYTATFSGPFGSGIKNAPIPTYLIEKYAGKRWVSYEMRQSVAAIDGLIAEGRDSSGVLQINASNLILLLQGNVYENFACNSVTGLVSKASLAEIQNAVRARVLELTIQLEKSIPAAVDISVGPSMATSALKDTETVTQITQQIVHGNLTTITNSGDGAMFRFNSTQRDAESLVKILLDAGISQSDANEFAEIVAAESAGNEDEPFGERARAWIVDNIHKAANGTWKIGVAVATKVLTEATLKYYGLK